MCYFMLVCVVSVRVVYLCVLLPPWPLTSSQRQRTPRVATRTPHRPEEPLGREREREGEREKEKRKRERQLMNDYYYFITAIYVSNLI